MTEPTTETPRETDAAAAPPWTRSSRPHLPSKVRLQWDDARGQAMLLFPEGVLMLNPTAHAVLRLVDGRRTLGEIVGELARSYDPAAAVRSEAESVDLSMDPGTDMGAHEAVSGSSTGSDPGLARAPAVSQVTGAAPDPAGAAVPGREAVIERDVIGFLRSLEARSWLVREPRPDQLTASAESAAGGASRTERKEPSR